MEKPSWSRRRRRIRDGLVLALASTTSAVSLNDLQPVLDGVLPAACSLVYNTAIQGCTTADFAKGETCSLSCIAGIKQIENNIDDPCQAVNNNALTLLNDALRGSLIVKLCIGNDFTLATTTSTSSSIRQTSTSTLLTNPLITTSLTTSLTTSQTVGSFSTIPFPTTISIQTTIPALTMTSQSIATQTTLSFVPPPNSSSSVLTTTQLSSTTTQSPVAETTSSTTSKATATSTSTSQNGDGRGGGSPFDTTSQALKLSLSWSLCLAAGVLVATLRLT